MQKISDINSVSILGAGNVGWHMALALKGCGIEIINIIAPSSEKASEIAKLAGAEPLTEIDQLTRLPDLFLICVSDDAIERVGAECIETGAFVAHTSGSTALDVFGDHSDHAGVFYPLQTFSRNNPMDYRTISFFIEGASVEMERRLSALAQKISGRWQIADSESRKLIHIAAVFSCNFANHMWAISHSLLKEQKIDFKILLPLIEETFRKLGSMDPVQAQTGPAKRLDRTTIDKHLAALGKKPFEQEIYERISENIINYSRRVNE